MEFQKNEIRLIKSISDCKGQIIRTTPSPLHIDIFKKLGFKPKPLDVRDFKLAIKNDEIEVLAKIWKSRLQLILSVFVEIFIYFSLIIAGITKKS